jgi:beta-lactamase regulating signal transducer with metallopeptidase domain
VDTLLVAGLANALVAAFLAVAVAGITRLWRRPAVAHALWLLVLLKLVTPPFVVVPLPWALPALAANTDGADATPKESVEPLREPAASPPADSGLPGAPAAPDPSTDPADPAPPCPPAAARRPLEATGDVLPLQGLVSVLWLSGAVIWWTVGAWRVACFQRLLRYAQLAPASVQEQARRVGHLLGLPASPGVWLVQAQVGPLLWALGPSPRLLVPAALWDVLTPDQRDTLLAHELAHLRRRDHWVRRLELVVLGLYWWHPVAWWARHELQEAEEQCCDAWVVWALPEAASAYATALVETIAFLSQTRRPVPVAASGIGHLQTLKRRLTMILRQPCPRALSSGSLLAILGLAILLLPLLPTWAQQPAADPSAKRRAAPEPAATAPRATQDRPVPFNANLPHPTPVGRGFVAQDPTAPKRAQANVPMPAQRELEVRLEQAEEDVALLEAQLQVKRAQLVAAQVSLRQAQEQLKRFKQLHEKGALSEATYAKAKDDAGSAEAQYQVKEAELREPEVRLQLARRRLERLQGSANARPVAEAKPAAKAAPLPAANPAAKGTVIDDRNRLLELERKLDRLLKEVEALRKQLPASPRPRNGAASPTLNERNFDYRRSDAKRPS